MSSPPLGAHVAAADQEIVQIQASSGTTGSPSYVGLTASDITTWCEMGARALYANGFRQGDRLLHAFGISEGFVGGLPMVQLAQYMGIVDIPIEPGKRPGSSGSCGCRRTSGPASWRALRTS